MSENQDIREVVREKYGAVAEGRASLGSCCGGSCGGEAVLAQLGYSPEQAAKIPQGADLGLGCGNPLAYAAVQPGETVLDLGSGAGIDVFLAAQEVGPKGRAIGVDMTASMLQRARANAVQGGYTNVEFRMGEIEHLPVADGSVDVIISNCVVNLSPHKEQVFAEALRALRPGGRMVVSDLVLLRPLPPEIRNSVEAYVGCVAGASLKDDYLRLIREAGFERVEVVNESSYDPGINPSVSCCGSTSDLGAVVSVKVRAYKPQARNRPLGNP